MKRQRLLPLLLLLMLLPLGCERGNLSRITAEGEGPQLVIDSPASSSRIPTGQEVAITSTASDESLVERIELWINGDLIADDPAPTEGGQPSFTVVQRWVPVEPGQASVEVYAYNAAGERSPPAAIVLDVVGEPLFVQGDEPTAEATPEETDVVIPTEEAEEIIDEPEVEEVEGMGGQVTAEGGLNVRSGPSVESERIGGVLLGEFVTGIARNAAGDWVKVRFGAEPLEGWVAAQYVSWEGDIETLPQE